MVLGRMVLVSAVAAVTTLSSVAPSLAAPAPCQVGNKTSGGPVISNLQDAVDDAHAGDTLKVRGTCRGQFRIDKSLRIVGPEGRHHTTLSAGREGRVLDIGNARRHIRVALVNLRVTQGEVSGPGGGIRSVDADLRLVHVNVGRNSAYRGAGIASGGALTLVDSQASNNEATDAGGGIIAHGHLTLRGDSRIQYNGARWAAGVWMRQGPMLMTGHSRVMENAGGSASGVAVGGGSLEMKKRAAVLHNTSSYLCGGIFSYGRVSLRGHSSVRHNVARDEGGGIYSIRGRVTLSGSSRVVANTSGTRGGGILAYARVALYDHSRVKRNLAQRGAGVTVLGASATVADSARVVDNRAARAGGGVLAVGQPRPLVRVLHDGVIRGNDPENVLVRVRPVMVPQA